MAPSPPKNRFQRAFQLATVGARTGASWAVSKGSDAAARHSAEVLGNLRGLAAKVGQTASYVDGLVPEAQREHYEKALSTLQRATPPSSFDSVRATIESELSAPLEQCFLQFEETPVASASIGQVHRAALPDGREVAVKVQHEGIEEAVEADLKNIGMLEGVVNLAAPRGMKAGPIFAEVLRRFRQELDYRVEAVQQQAFFDFHTQETGIFVPLVHHAWCSRRVLTSEWVSGMSMEEAVRQPDGVRRLYAERMWRFVFRGNLVGGAFNADPHPGNYLFHPDGSVHFLDFGCVQPIPDGVRAAAVLAHQGALAGDFAAFDAAVALMLSTRGGVFGEATRMYTRRCFEPMFASPFRITREYAAELFRAATELKRSMRAKDKSFVAPPPQLALMNRLQFGFYSVLAQLDVEADYRAVEESFLEEALSTQRGTLGLN